MVSTRRRLSISYASASFATGLLFAIAIWIAGVRASEHRTDELFRRQARLSERADSVIRYIRSHIDGGRADKITTVAPLGILGILVSTDSGPEQRLPASEDSLDIIADAIQVWLNERATALTRAGLPEYLVLYSQDLRPLFTSRDFKRLLASVPPDSALSVLNTLSALDPDKGHRVANYFGRRLILMAKREPTGASKVSHVVVGTEVPPASFGFGGIALTFLLLSPVFAAVSLWSAYQFAVRPLRPVDRIINEVEAITDGRSLHRRLAIGQAGTELDRLTSTLNAMMERLEASFGALRTFTADASHELNTPLAVLRADVERAMTADPGGTDQMMALDEALREIARMTDLVESLLTLARADERHFDLHMEPVHLPELVHDVFETAQLLGEEAHVSVYLTSLEPGTVLGDRDRLRHMLLNLISNAIKYTPAGGRVDISLTTRLDGIAFAVRDTGIGISAGDLPYIFERFWRADHSRSRGSVRSGFGLGLPIASWIARAHGGTLTATSKLGKGSTFTATFPPLLEAADAGPTQVAVAADAKGST